MVQRRSRFFSTVAKSLSLVAREALRATARAAKKRTGKNACATKKMPASRRRPTSSGVTPTLGIHGKSNRDAEGTPHKPGDGPGLENRRTGLKPRHYNVQKRCRFFSREAKCLSLVAREVLRATARAAKKRTGKNACAT